jgi:hypothetical protein
MPFGAALIGGAADGLLLGAAAALEQVMPP